jgi:hypothetical protein
VLRTSEGKEIARIEQPIRYMVGSGTYSRTFLFEADGFLHESPITWYASRKQWAMSPGYDSSHHFGFDRPVTVGCLVCHAGRVESAAGAVHRVIFREKAIGCESCHGPGSVHQNYQRTHSHVPGEDDLTIVRPDKLSRSLQEAICAACHLHGAATVRLRGRGIGEFRPGLPLTDFRAAYRFATKNEQMTVVGHVEQMRQSACYQKSADMTCLSCHDMHARTVPKDKVAAYRKKCLTCHEHSCKLQPDDRHKQNAQDDCTACHMPRGDTDVPHVAFTHHRVGIHKDRPHVPPATDAPDLIVVEDGPQWSELDRQRNLGLAYLEVARDSAHSQFGEMNRERARELLEEVHSQGLREGEMSQALAEIYSTRDLARARTFAQEALTLHDLLPPARAGALAVLAHADMQQGEFAAAAGTLEQLVKMRRYADDWRLLGVCYLKLNEARTALSALKQSLRIRPSRQMTHAALADAYRRLGDEGRAREHDSKAQWLLMHGKN